MPCSIIVQAIDEMNIPVRYVGVGEAVDDLQDLMPRPEGVVQCGRRNGGIKHGEKSQIIGGTGVYDPSILGM